MAISRITQSNVSTLFCGGNMWPDAPAAGLMVQNQKKSDTQSRG